MSEVTPPLVAAKGVSLALGGATVLERIDLAVHARELVSLIGPNGSGKTTLIRILLGLAAPDGGTVERRPGLRVGYVPQKLAIDRSLPLTAMRFLALHRAVPRDKRRAALAEAGIGHAGERAVQDLSGGEFQRLLLARALLADPDLLVLDEPAQGIDINGQVELYRRIAALRAQRGCGILLVSHDLHLVMAETDTVFCINHHVCCTGKPESVANDPAYIALFGKSAAATLGVYAHRHDHEHDLAGHVHDTHGHRH